MGLSSYLHRKKHARCWPKSCTARPFLGFQVLPAGLATQLLTAVMYMIPGGSKIPEDSSRALSPCCCSTRGWIYDGRDIVYPPLWCCMGTWTSKVPKTMAAIPQLEGIWTILLGISEVQVHLTSPACSYDLMPGLASPWNCCSRDSQYRRPRTPLLDFGRYLTSRCKVLG